METVRLPNGRDGYWAGKTVVVTGGTGFVGSHVAEELLARQASVVCLYRRDNRDVLAQLPVSDRLRLVRLDLLDAAELRRLFAGVPSGVDAVVHCAAVSGTPEVRRHQSAGMLDTNIRAVSNILDCARRYGVTDTVLLSSSDVYLSPTTEPIHEDDGFKTQLRYAPDGYYLAKVYMEILAEEYRNEHGMRIFVPRPTSIYGPRDNFQPDTIRVVPSMFAKAAAGREIEVWGDGSQTRTYIYVTDLVRAMLRMVEGGTHWTVNIGTEETVALLDLARRVCCALGRPELVRTRPDRPGGRQSRTLDLDRMRELVDFTPRSLAEGLRLTADWYRGRSPAERAAS